MWREVTMQTFPVSRFSQCGTRTQTTRNLLSDLCHENASWAGIPTHPLAPDGIKLFHDTHISCTYTHSNITGGRRRLWIMAGEQSSQGV